MKYYTILGCDDSFVSMIFENLSALFEKSILYIDIIKNIEIQKERIPYHVPGVRYNEIYAASWGKKKGNYILGVVKPSSKLAVKKYFYENHQIKDEDYVKLIHPDTTIGQTAKIGYGVMINPGVTLAPYVIIGKYVFLNRNVSIGHHTQIGQDTNINPGVNIASHCRIGKEVSIGMGANIINHVSIGDNTVVGAGSLVTKNIPSNVVAYGSPAKVIREIG